MVLLITKDDIAQVDITPEDVIAAVESGYRQDGLGLAQDTPRDEVKIKGKHLPHIAPGVTSIGLGAAYLEESGALIVNLGYTFDFKKFINQIIDPETGKTLAILKRVSDPSGPKPKTIGAAELRTGAAAAVGAKYLAREQVENVGVIGTGRIGKESLICMSKVRDFSTVYAHSGRRKDEEYGQMMGNMLGIDIIASESIEEVVKKSDILITSTFAQEPVIKGEWLKEGTCITGLGADGPMKAELDHVTFQKASKVYIDSQRCFSTKELAHPIKEGLLKPEDITGRIGECVAGVKPRRENDTEITIFKTEGTHMQTAAVVWLLYQKVKEAGYGTEVPDLPSAEFFINP